MATKDSPAADKTPETESPPDRTFFWAVAVLVAVAVFFAGYQLGQAKDEPAAFAWPGADFAPGFPGPSDRLGPSGLPGRGPAAPRGISDPVAGGGWLGIAGVDGPAAVRVVEVRSGSPADDAGIEVGDRIVAYDGVEIDSMQQLVDLVRATAPGTEVELIIGRPGRVVEVTIGERS